MSKTEELRLPDQPLDGEVERLPLGGDGYTSPFACYSVQMNVEGDASGGYLRSVVRMDPRYVALVNTFTTQGRGITADTPCQQLIHADGTMQLLRQENITFLPITGANKQGTLVWQPPAIIMPAKRGSEGSAVSDPPLCMTRITNPGVGIWIEVYLVLYLFAAEARETTPLAILQDVLKR